jgi:hypothetical protein
MEFLRARGRTSIHPVQPKGEPARYYTTVTLAEDVAEAARDETAINKAMAANG